MRMFLFVPFLVVSFISGPAETPSAPATRTLLSSCPEAKPVILAFFTERGFTQSPDPSCPECVSLKNEALQDASGHKVEAKRIVKDYVEGPPQEKRSFGVWEVYSKPVAKATVHLDEAASGCLVSLLFDYTWISTRMVAAIPKEADPESRPSNRRLERQYLDSITVRVLHTP